MNFLLSQGHSASRINTTGIYEQATGQWRKSGARVGFFDIVACLKPKGLYLTIDTKTGSDRPSDEQLKYQKEVQSANGVAIFVSSYTEFLEYYKLVLGFEINEIA